eukprot:7853125-Lingulodinium_polyedra.AAC.1
MPGHVDSVLSIVETQRWTRPICPPARLSAATLPANGHDGSAPWEVKPPPSGQAPDWARQVLGRLAPRRTGPG